MELEFGCYVKCIAVTGVMNLMMGMMPTIMIMGWEEDMIKNDEPEYS